MGGGGAVKGGGGTETVRKLEEQGQSRGHESTVEGEGRPGGLNNRGHIEASEEKNKGST